MRTTTIALALAALVAGTAASAQSPINARQLNQERRIDAGTRSGKLTQGEAGRLRAQQRSIAQMKAQLKARHGGHLTKADERMLHARQAKANRDILREKDNRRRGPNKLKL